MMAALAGSDLAIVHLLIGTLISGCLSCVERAPPPSPPSRHRARPRDIREPRVTKPPPSAPVTHCARLHVKVAYVTYRHAAAPSVKSLLLPRALVP